MMIKKETNGFTMTPIMLHIWKNNNFNIFRLEPLFDNNYDFVSNFLLIKVFFCQFMAKWWMFYSYQLGYGPKFDSETRKNTINSLKAVAIEFYGRTNGKFTWTSAPPIYSYAAPWRSITIYLFIGLKIFIQTFQQIRSAIS